MTTRSEATSTPSAGPSAIIDAKWDVAHVEDRHPRARCAAGRLQPAGLAAIRHRRGRCRLRRRRRQRRHDHRPRRPDRAVPDPRIDPLLGWRTEDGSRRVHRARRAGDGISHLSRVAGARSAAGANRSARCHRPPRPLREAILENDLYRVTHRPPDRRDARLACQARRLGGALGPRQRRARASKTAATSGSFTRASTAAAGSR